MTSMWSIICPRPWAGRLLHVITVRLKSKIPSEIPGQVIDPQKGIWRAADSWAEGLALDDAGLAAEPSGGQESFQQVGRFELDKSNRLDLHPAAVFPGQRADARRRQPQDEIHHQPRRKQPSALL
ncbi:hypothetical protein [Streptomyces sp. NPDC005046]